MDKTFAIGIFAWLFPGGGHFALKRNRRGLIISLSVWGMFVIGAISGGAYYPGFNFNEGQLLYLLNIFATAGNGIGSAISFLLSVNPVKNAAEWVTFEYGGRFMEAAGLLNYLAILDAVDIHLGRKK